MLTPGVAASAYPSETAHFRPIVDGELRLRLLYNKSFIAQERWGASKQTYQFHFWWRAARALGSMPYLLHCAFTTSKSPIRTAGISDLPTSKKQITEGRWKYHPDPQLLKYKSEPPKFNYIIMDPGCSTPKGDVSPVILIASRGDMDLGSGLRVQFSHPLGVSYKLSRCYPV